MDINILPGANSAASALQAEKVRMEVISQNIANASTTSTPAGGPYQRQVVRFETIMEDQFNLNSAVREVRVAGIENDQRPFRLVYQPGHPDADQKTGMVKYPNVSVHEEMADLIASSRPVEANRASIRTARTSGVRSGTKFAASIHTFNAPDPTRSCTRKKLSAPPILPARVISTAMTMPACSAAAHATPSPSHKPACTAWSSTCPSG